jgi:uncharacterized protein YutE (UPF0331/DUF86 family)
MTPRAIDSDSITAKLELMDEALRHLSSVGDVDAERLRTDGIVRGAVERYLAQLVDLAVAVNLHVSASKLGRVARDYRDTFRLAAEAGLIVNDLADALAPSVGLRNLLIHEYQRIDVARVAEAVPLTLRFYRRYVEAVAAFVRDETDRALEGGN